MRKLSIWSRRFANVINASMLSVVLLLYGCAAGRESRTIVRSDSLSRTETEVTTYESVPMTRMNLPLPQDHLLMIGKLPQGFGISVKENGIGLKVESDGKGGLSIAAETEDLQKKVITRKSSERQSSNVAQEEKKREEKPSFWQRIKIKIAGGMILAIVLFLFLRWFKNKLRKN